MYEKHNTCTRGKPTCSMHRTSQKHTKYTHTLRTNRRNTQVHVLTHKRYNKFIHTNLLPPPSSPAIHFPHQIYLPLTQASITSQPANSTIHIIGTNYQCSSMTMVRPMNPSEGSVIQQHMRVDLLWNKAHFLYDEMSTLRANLNPLLLLLDDLMQFGVPDSQ